MKLQEAIITKRKRLVNRAQGVGLIALMTVIVCVCKPSTQPAKLKQYDRHVLGYKGMLAPVRTSAGLRRCNVKNELAGVSSR